MKRALLGIILATLLGCGGSEGNTNTFDVETVPSVADVTLRFTEPLPEEITAITFSGLAEPAEEHDHEHAREEEEEHDDHILVYGPTTRAVAPEMVFSDVPSNVIEVELEFLAGEESAGHAHIEVTLEQGGNFIIEDPPLEDEHEGEEEHEHEEEEG